MRQSIGVGSVALGERAKQTFRAHRTAAFYVAYMATGFLSANAFVLGGLAPFGVAFSAATKQRYAPAATLGAVLGYLVCFRSMSNIKYVAAMLLVFFLRWGIATSSIARRAQISRQVICAASLGIPSLTFTFLSGGNIYDAALAVAEVMLACCACYFFDRTVEAIDLGIANLTQADITSMTITFCITILALIHLKIFGLSLGRMLAVITILLAAQIAKEAGGAIAGVTAGIAAGILGGQYGFLMGTYGFGGLLAGVFASLGRVASVSAFILVNTFAVLAARQTVDKLLLVEIFVAAAITMFFPINRIRAWIERQAQGDAVRGETYRDLLSGKINHIAGALRDVADTTRQVNEKLAALTAGDISTVYHCAADRVCRRCKNSSVCWQLRHYDTTDALNHALGVLRASEKLTEADFPDYFARTCLKLPELTAQMNQLFAEYTSRESTRRKVAQVRGVVTDQFEGMALMIDAMGQELDGLSAQDDKTAAKVREYMRTLTIYPDRVFCTLDSGANMTLEMTLPAYKLNRIDRTELTISLSEICGREFDLPACYTEEDLVTMTFSEKAAYTVRWGASQLGCGGSRICGDSYSHVDGQNGRINFILSDGMGSGGSAAVDSTMTAELLKRLISAGVSMDAALKLVNSALLVKSGEESLATIDITGIDLYTGRAEFYKAGAVPTFLRKSGKGGYVQSNSLPVGILNGVSFEKNIVTLREGDLILMVSDGAVCNGYDWIVSDLERFVGDDPQLLSEQIVEEAKRRRNDGHDDDITAIAVMLERGI